MEQESSAFLSSDPNAGNKLIDVLKIDGAWTKVEGFPQPDWRCIGEFIKLHYPAETQPDAWDEACIQWVDAIRYVLGPAFQVYESNNFLILTNKTPNNAQYALKVCEGALRAARNFLGKLAWQWENGKHAIFMFEDIDLYFQYISHFNPEEGEFSASEAFLNNGYCHSALFSPHDAVPGIIFGATYQCLAHLRIPIWLKHGLAFTTRKNIPAGIIAGLNETAFEERIEYWTKDTIQEFWGARSFDAPDSSSISYCFAQILVENIRDAYQQFDDFVLKAKLSDAGESSAIAHLGESLNVIVSAFLGEGEWTPNPFVINIKDVASGVASGGNLYDFHPSGALQLNS